MRFGGGDAEAVRALLHGDLAAEGEGVRPRDPGHRGRLAFDGDDPRLSTPSTIARPAPPIGLRRFIAGTTG
ncbi:hypothetical protein ACFQY0_20585 [Haloferula chungangensis]|uniref:Uncharacterized protein n=1 Tax=Haloferula chungangensis TaxID=1048331 RepID=A0ABW2LAV5_9BACT